MANQLGNEMQTLRAAAADLERVKAARDRAIVQASRAGYSRRKVGEAASITHARVQQIVSEWEAQNDPASGPTDQWKLRADHLRRGEYDPSMAVDGAAGFWSYAHEDDAGDGGRIRALARSVRAEFSLLTGEELTLFIDHDLEWGDEWKARIDDALSNTTFLIPILTPRYFTRPECRRELLTFAGHAKSLGFDDLLLAIYYVDIPGFDADEESDDEAVTLVKSMQWQDWRELRLESPDSATYRQSVNGLAKRLAEINRAQRDQRTADVIPAVGPVDDLEFFDKLADAEDAMPKLNAVMDHVSEELEAIGSLADEWSPKVAKASSVGARASVKVFKGFAADLSARADRMDTLSKEYASELLKIDSGMLTLIRLAHEQPGPDADDLLDSVRGLKATADEALGQLGELIAILDQVSRLSRDLRLPMGKLRDGLQRILDGAAIIDEWERSASHLQYD